MTEKFSAGVNGILIVEDNLIIADYLQDTLERMGYRVCGIATGYLSALKYLQTETVDLVLIDIYLEGDKTGIDLARYISKHFPFIPFVFLTSSIDGDTIARATETCPSGFLTKPFTLVSIHVTLEIALHNSKMGKIAGRTL